VFEQFVTMKQTCNESIAGLVFSSLTEVSVDIDS
jgi:hypothetical protein